MNDAGISTQILILEKMQSLAVTTVQPVGKWKRIESIYILHVGTIGSL
jgi:hypothetical protein